MDNHEADYESYSDWESPTWTEVPTSAMAKSAPLKFVLVEDEDAPVDERTHEVHDQRGRSPLCSTDEKGDAIPDSREARESFSGTHGSDGRAPFSVLKSSLSVGRYQDRRRSTSMALNDRGERIPRQNHRIPGQGQEMEKPRKRFRSSGELPIVSSEELPIPKQRLRRSHVQNLTGAAGEVLDAGVKARIPHRKTQKSAPNISSRFVSVGRGSAKEGLHGGGETSNYYPSTRVSSRMAHGIGPGEEKQPVSPNNEPVRKQLPTPTSKTKGDVRHPREISCNMAVPPSAVGAGSRGGNQQSLPIQEIQFQHEIPRRTSKSTSTPAPTHDDTNSHNTQSGEIFGLQSHSAFLHGFQRPFFVPHVHTPSHPGALYSNPMSESIPVCDIPSAALLHGGMRTPGYGSFPIEHVAGFTPLPSGFTNFAPPLPLIPGGPFTANFGSDTMQAANFHPAYVANPGRIPLGAVPDEMVGSARDKVPVRVVSSQSLNTDVIVQQGSVLPSSAQTTDIERNAKMSRKPQDRDKVMDGRSKAEARSNDCPQMTSAPELGSKTSATKRTACRTGSGKAIEVDEIPCEDDDDDLEDYVSRLNEIPQKQKYIALVRPQWQPVRVRSGGGSGWMCRMKATVLKKSPQEVIECVSVARNKSRAKRAAAKEMLLKLRSTLPEVFLSENQAKQSNQYSRVQSAINALHQLAQEGNLPCQPGYDVEEVNEAGENHWRCTTTLFTRDHDSKVFVEYGPSKNAAKQKGARRALEAIIKLKSPGADQYQNLLRPPDVQPTKTMANIPGASEAIFRSEDDEISHASCDDLLEETGQRLELPADYELIIAETDSDCEKWFSKHAQPGAQLGIYVDSDAARDSVYKDKEVEDNREHRKIKFPILCFSTALAGIVVRVDKRESSAGTSEVPGIEESTFWVPDVVANTLEDTRVCKAALGCDEGLEELFERHGIQADGVQDVGLTSIAIAGLGRVDGRRQFSSLRQLTKYWMRQEVKDINWQTLWPKRSELPDVLRGAAGKEIAAAVLSAFAVRCVRVKLSEAARMKRMSMPGVSNDLAVLCKRILDDGTS